MLTILFAHPKHESLNGQIYRAIAQRCMDSGRDHTAIDLYRDGFSPVLTAEELDHFYSGIAFDPLVKRYQEILLKTERLVALFPIWFNEYPAILKGFFERVCLGKFAFDYTDGGIAPRLTNIQSALVVTTSHAPTEVLRQYSGNIIENQFIGHMLKGIGVSSNEWLNLGGVKEATRQQQQAFISSVVELL